MRIGINATILHEKPSGLGIFTINIIREVAKKMDENNKLVIYTSNAEPFKELDVEIRLAPKLISPKYKKVGGLFRFLWSQLIYPIKLKKDKVDLVYSTTHHGTFFSNIPQIITIHDLLPIIFPNQHRLQNYYFKYITPILLKNTNRVITVSHNTKKDIISEYEYKDIDIVYNSYDKEHFVKKKNNHFKKKYGDYFLFLGASYPHKNLENAVKAFFLLNEENPNLKMVIAGGQKSYRDELLSKIKEERGDLNNIEIIDYVSYKDLPVLYSNSLALLYPSYYEGFGIPPIEAMACGCPVIVSNTSSLPEVCSDAAVYIEPGNVDSIKDGMEKILNNEEYKNQLIELGYKNIERFSWEDSAEKLINCLRI